MNNDKIKVLLVEDERMLAEILADTLSDHNFEIKTADNGVVALGLWRKFRPDVIVTDIMMPQMDGVELLHEVRKLGQTPVIMLTARGALEDKVAVLELGADDYIVKPFAMAEVTARVRSALRRATTPVSSRNSRFIASSGDSPFSRYPPGMIHFPFPPP